MLSRKHTHTRNPAPANNASPLPYPPSDTGVWVTLVCLLLLSILAVGLLG